MKLYKVIPYDGPRKLTESTGFATRSQANAFATALAAAGKCTEASTQDYDEEESDDDG